MKQFTLSFSKRYPLFIIITISTCLIAVSIVTITTLSNIYHTSVEYAKHTTIMYIEAMSLVIYKSLQTIQIESKKINKKINIDNPILTTLNDTRYIVSACIAKPAQDDRHYSIVHCIKESPSLSGKSKIDTTKEYYIRKGLIAITIDPTIKMYNSIAYIESYIPLQMKDTPHVLIVQWSASPIMLIQQTHDSAIRTLTQSIAIIIALTIIIILALSFIHSMRTQALLKKLSMSIQSIATGTLDVTLNENVEGELKDLAISFNTLIEEIRSKDDNLKKLQEKDPFLDIFKRAVELLKQACYDDAIVLFKTVILYKPDHFPSYFNLGVCYAKKSEFSIALENFSKAHNLNPEFELTVRYIEKLKALHQQQAYDRKFSNKG